MVDYQIGSAGNLSSLHLSDVRFASLVWFDGLLSPEHLY